MWQIKGCRSWRNKCRLSGNPTVRGPDCQPNGNERGTEEQTADSRPARATVSREKEQSEIADKNHQNGTTGRLVFDDSVDKLTRRKVNLHFINHSRKRSACETKTKSICRSILRSMEVVKVTLPVPIMRHYTKTARGLPAKRMRKRDGNIKNRFCPICSIHELRKCT